MFNSPQIGHCPKTFIPHKQKLVSSAYSVNLVVKFILIQVFLSSSFIQNLMVEEILEASTKAAILRKSKHMPTAEPTDWHQGNTDTQKKKVAKKPQLPFKNFLEGLNLFFMHVD